MDEQNQNEMKNEEVPHEEAPVGETSSTEVHVENNEEGKSNMLGTLAIVILVALLGYGIYAYFNRDDGMVVEEEETTLEGEVDLEADAPALEEVLPVE